MQAEQAVTTYLEELRKKGRRASTLRGYESDLRVLVACASRSSGALDQHAVDEYLAWPTAHAAATQARRLSALRGLLRSCGREDLLHTDRSVEQQSRNDAKRVVRSDLRSAIDAVFAVIPVHADRDHLLFGLLARLGLRPGEALALHVADFDESSATLSVPGWGGKRRRVLVDDREVLLRLTNYLRFHAPRSGPLFTAAGRETPLRYQSVQHRWAKYCGAADADVQLSDLRRAHVADLVSGGVPEGVIRERIGQPSGALAGVPVSISNEESDAAIRAWQESRGAMSERQRHPRSEERRIG